MHGSEGEVRGRDSRVNFNKLTQNCKDSQTSDFPRSIAVSTFPLPGTASKKDLLVVLVVRCWQIVGYNN
jgi:hypothetical protein